MRFLLRSLLLLVPLGLIFLALLALNRAQLVTFGDGPDLTAYLPVPWGSPKISFNDQVQPILSSNCYLCHGPDSGSRKANLRLDRGTFAFQPRDNGKAVLIPGHPEQSEVYRRISSTDPAEMMPPPKSHHPLKPEEIAIIKAWIKQGAVYQEHWSYIKPVRPSVPWPSLSHWSWPANPIDNFVLAKLEQNKLEPQPEADRRSLIRRVTLDLTGLPPTPAEVEAFVKDTSANAYEKVVDRLLASPRYGENEARYWLDAARFGDTHGIHKDNYRSMWPYRDWVINAFNQNMRFDEFTTEQLAGDLLPNATLEQKIASGFNRCSPSTSEGGSIDAEVLAMYAKERVETTTEVFLGETMGCAACHDHKFDPITQKDFYSMSAFFRNTTQPALDQNRSDAPPSILVPSPEDRTRWDALPGEIEDRQKPLDAKIAAAKTMLPKLVKDLDWTATLKPVSNDKLDFSLPLREGSGRQVTTSDGKVAQFSTEPKWVEGAAGKAPQFDGKTGTEFGPVGNYQTTDSFTASFWTKVGGKGSGVFLAHLDESDNQRGWEIDIDQNRVALVLNSGPQNTVKTTTDKTLEQNMWQNVCVTYDGSGKADGIKIYFDGKLQSAKANTPVIEGSIYAEVPLSLAQRPDGGAPLKNVALQDLRLYHRALASDEIERLTDDERILALQASGDPGMWTPGQQEAYVAVYLSRKDADYRQILAKKNLLVAEQDAIRKRSPVSLIMEEKPEAPYAYILKRGQYDQPAEKVFADVPGIFPALPADQPRNRLGLAEWLTGPDNPLLARVTVNRFWQQFFGVGIVKTSEDFGIMGERPVNQPLLDWLAVEFRESGWDVKHMMKLMVMSSAYRQASVETPQLVEADPENRLVSRGPRYRLDAEVIRDQALAASDLLVEKIGGPSVKPYQPAGIWESVAMAGSDTQHYVQDRGENLYRRSLYTFWKRSAPPSSLETFNAPSRETCTVRRERTDTPLQALAIMNDPQFMEASRHLAAKAIAGGSDDSARLDYLSNLLLSRPLQDEEKQVLEDSLNQFLSIYEKNPQKAAALLKIGDSPQPSTAPAPEQAAWTMVASQFLNLDEALNN
jgi:hypothetical protein